MTKNELHEIYEQQGPYEKELFLEYLTFSQKADDKTFYNYSSVETLSDREFWELADYLSKARHFLMLMAVLTQNSTRLLNMTYSNFDLLEIDSSDEDFDERMSSFLWEFRDE